MEANTWSEWAYVWLMWCKCICLCSTLWLKGPPPPHQNSFVGFSLQHPDRLLNIFFFLTVQVIWPMMNSLCVLTDKICYCFSIGHLEVRNEWDLLQTWRESLFKHNCLLRFWHLKSLVLGRSRWSMTLGEDVISDIIKGLCLSSKENMKAMASAIWNK